MNYQQLLALFKETHLELQQRAARLVDTSLVIRNWLFGWYIVEFEQGGAERVELYGKRLIDKLSRELKTLGLKGISSTSLRQCLPNLQMLELLCRRFNRHCLLRCYVLIDLKRDKLTHQDLGQMPMYSKAVQQTQGDLQNRDAD